MIVSNDHDDDTPEGWSLVTLRGGPYAGHRYTIHDSDDKLTLHTDDGEAHDYHRLNHRPELHHESVISAAMKNRGG